MRTNGKAQKVSIPRQGDGYNALLGILANQIGEPDKRPKKIRPVAVVDIPEEWDIERDMYLAQIEIVSEGEIPHADDLVKILRMRGHANAQQFINILLKDHVTEGRGTTSLHKLFSDWQKYNAALTLVQIAQQRLLNDGPKVVSDVLTDVQNSIPRLNISVGGVVSDMSPEEQLTEWQAAQIEAVQLKAAGKSYYVPMPWHGFDEYIGAIRTGDPILITAATGVGKTTVASVAGERLAWQHNCYVLYISKETAQRYLHQRRIARIMGIPTRYSLKDVQHPDGMVVPLFEPTNPVWRPIIDKYREYLRHKAATAGIFRTLAGVNIKVEELIPRILEHKYIADQKGMPLVVIWDYLQKFPWKHYHQDERMGLTILAREIKNFVQDADIRAIVFAQEANRTKQTDGTLSDPVPFGSGEAQKSFQVHISIERKRAVDNHPVVTMDKHNREVQLYDRLGNPRFYARAGQWSGVAQMYIVKANDDESGRRVPLLMEGALHRVDDAGDAPVEYERMDVGVFRKAGLTR